MSNLTELPLLSYQPAHAGVVSTLARLPQTHVESFLSRCTRSHTAALFLREVLYWLSPANVAPDRPRSTVFRDGHYWMVRTQEEWKKLNDIGRTSLATVYRRCKDLIEMDHFMFASQRRTHYRIKFEKLRELMEGDEDLQACLQSDLDALKERRALKSGQRRAVSTPECSPSLHSLDDSFNSIADTGCARACAFVDAPAEPGTAAPEPPLIAPPARSPSGIAAAEATLEEPEAKPEVTSFRQVQAILQQAEDQPTVEKLRRIKGYADPIRRALGYLLVWQGESERLNQTCRFSETHWVQAREFAQREEVDLQEFLCTVRAAWKAQPIQGYDPLFMCSHHSRKFSSFLKHFQRMADELDQSEG